MIYSMTAFARAEVENDAISLVCEMKSINHRYLEINMHLPEALRVLEMALREKIRQSLQRGKVECSFKYQITSSADMFHVNESLVKNLSKACLEIAKFLPDSSPISASDVLRFPNVLELKQIDPEELQQLAEKLLTTTLNELMAARGREGEEIKKSFLQRIKTMRENLDKVKTRLPAVILEQQEKIKKRFSEVKLDVDNNRLEQEIVLFSQRVDVAEEVERTETHLQEISRILAVGGMVGRRLDFLLQELNREANTLGSKSTDSVLTHAAVELKVLIEQIREQVQNVE